MPWENILLRRRTIQAFVVLLLLVSCVPPPRAETRVDSNRPLAFLHVNVVVPAENRILADQTVVVETGRIVSVGPAARIRVPKGAHEVDGRGKYLMPGLVDTHVHLRDPSELLSYLAHGVTTVVHMSGPMANVPDVLALRGQIASGEVLGPTVFTTGRILDGDPPIFRGVSTVVTTPEEAMRAVAEQHRAGVDFVKVYNNLEPKVLEAIVAEAHRRGLAVVGHIPRRVGRPQALQAALGAGQDMIAHSEEIFFTYFYGDTEERLKRGEAPAPDRTQIPKVVAMIRESGAAVTPNLSFVVMTARQLDDLDAVLADPEFRYLHPQVAEMWREQNPTHRRDLERFTIRERVKYAFLQELVRALAKGGVPLLAGSDASAPGMYPGRSLHVELEEFVKAGLSPAEALTAATNAPAGFITRHVRNAEAFGEVRPGTRADLVLLDANPLEAIPNASRIAGVAVRGRWLPKADLERLRRETDGRP